MDRLRLAAVKYTRHAQLNTNHRVLQSLSIVGDLIVAFGCANGCTKARPFAE
jgi:hypothetical protein